MMRAHASLAETRQFDQKLASGNEAVIGRIVLAPVIPMPISALSSGVRRNNSIKEVTVRLFSEAQDQICRSRKLSGGQFSQILVRGTARAEIEPAAHQVLTPIFKKLLDDPAHFNGMAIRIDITQPHPSAEMNISLPPYEARIPSTLKRIGHLHDRMIEYIVATASQELNPCP